MQEQKSAQDRAALTAALEENKKLKETLEDVQKLGAAPTILIYKKPKGEREDAIAGVIASDWHVEEPVEPESINGLNEFSLEIAKTRSQHFFQNALTLVDLAAAHSTVRTIFASFLGDFATNYRHEDNQETNELPPTEAFNYAKSLLASGVDFWLRESPYRLVIDCVDGNHGQIGKKKRVANRTGMSLESFMFHAMAERYENNPRVEFRVAKGKMLYRTLFERFVVREIHGDDIGYQGGIGGVTIPILKKIAGWDQAVKSNLTIMGHFHEHIPARRFIVNGSLIGYNAYAQSISASPEEAKQSFYLVTARGGGDLSLQAPIWLDARHRTEKSGATSDDKHKTVK